MTLAHNKEDVASAPAVRLENGNRVPVNDPLTVETPLHIRVNGEAFTTTMRTPGADPYLAHGLLFTEGILAHPTPDLPVETLPDPDSGLTVRLDVTLPDSALAKPVAGRRSMLAASSCGVCGTREPADLELYGPPIQIRPTAPLPIARLAGMFDSMRDAQSNFAQTGGCHAAAIFAADGTLLASHEDIGRHNAVDKTIGELLARAALDSAHVLTVSGRVSYEIVTKAYRAGIPILAAVSAPSSMAVETCDRFGITLLAFCRDARATAYTHTSRIEA